MKEFFCPNIERERHYPSNNFSSRVQKDALQQHLLTPLFAQSPGSVLACRLVWRITGPLAETAWDQLAINRRSCDRAIVLHPDVSFFVSSVTGVFNKANRAGMATQNIYPALAYWIVFNQPVIDPTPVLTSLRAVANDKPEVRIIGNIANTPYASMCSGLYAVLKDYSNTFVQKKLARSLTACGIEPTDLAMATSKVVMVSDTMLDFVTTALEGVRQSSKLCLLLQSDNSDLLDE